MHVRDLQSAWLLFLFCAGPRANHLLRLLPPTVVDNYATQHDNDLWTTFSKLVSQPQLQEERPQSAKARAVAGLPSNFGGLSLRSAKTVSDSAYWAAWADALKVLTAKVPERAAAFTAALDGEQVLQANCLREANEARSRLLAKGFVAPAWAEVAHSDAQHSDNDSDYACSGDWTKGWQSSACRSLDTHFLRHVVTPSLTSRQKTLLDSQSGPLAGRHFTALPTQPNLRIKPDRFLSLLRRRLFLTLPLAPRTCPGRTCQKTLDRRGDHLSSCSRTGYLKLRSLPLERCWAQVFREAGARVAENQFLGDLGLPGVAPSAL